MRQSDKDDLVTLLGQFCNLLYRFQYDKAKEVVDEFRLKRLNTLQLPVEELSAWSTLIQCLSPLASADKCYMTLSFLLPRGFLRKESPLRSNYTNIRNDLQKLASGLKDDGQNNHPNKCLVGHLCLQFSAYVSARMDLMNCYDSLSTLLRDNGLTIDEAILLVSEIQLKNKGTFHHPAMEPLEQSFSYEVEILINLLKCNLKITQLRFIECLFHFKEAQSSLKIWSSESTDGNVLKFHQSSSWFNLTGSSKVQNLPSVCIWLKRFYDSVLAKFTMYFYNLLGEQTTPQELKNQVAKLQYNHYQTIVNFHRKHDAANVCLLLNVQHLNHFQWRGYSHSSQQQEPLKGLENYPVVFSFPSERPTYFLPSAVMILTEHAETLMEKGQIAFVFDKTVETMFFVTRVESCVFLVLTFNRRIYDRDPSIKFMSELCGALRCFPVFSSLKLAKQ